MMWKKALKVAGFLALSIVVFNLYLLFDRTFITHTSFTFEFMKNIMQPAFLGAWLAVVCSFMRSNGKTDGKQTDGRKR